MANNDNAPQIFFVSLAIATVLSQAVVQVLNEMDEMDLDEQYLAEYYRQEEERIKRDVDDCITFNFLDTSEFARDEEKSENESETMSPEEVNAFIAEFEKELRQEEEAKKRLDIAFPGVDTSEYAIDDNMSQEKIDYDSDPSYLRMSIDNDCADDDDDIDSLIEEIEEALREERNTIKGPGGQILKLDDDYDDGEDPEQGYNEMED